MPTPTTDPRPQQPTTTTSYDRATNFLSLTLLVGAPILLLLPPRKLDLYTFSLCTAFVYSANHQTRSLTGTGILQQLSLRAGRDRGGVGGERDGDSGRVERWSQKGRMEEREVEEEEREIGSVILDQIREVWRVDEGKKKEVEAERGSEKGK